MSYTFVVRYSSVYLVEVYSASKLTVDHLSYCRLADCLLSVGMTTCVLMGVRWGLIGVDFQPADRGLQERLFWAMDVLATLSEGFTRVSTLFFLQRIFCVSGHSMWFRNTIYVGIGIVSLWTVAFVILPLLQCGTDLDYLNDSASVIAQRCDHGVGPEFVLSYAISSVVIEALSIALPVPLILKLQLSFRKRLAITFIFLRPWYPSLPDVPAFRLPLPPKASLDQHSGPMSQTSASSWFSARARRWWLPTYRPSSG